MNKLTPKAKKEIITKAMQDKKEIEEITGVACSIKIRRSFFSWTNMKIIIQAKNDVKMIYEVGNNLREFRFHIEIGKNPEKGWRSSFFNRDSIEAIIQSIDFGIRNIPDSLKHLRQRREEMLVS